METFSSKSNPWWLGNVLRNVLFIFILFWFNSAAYSHEVLLTNESGTFESKVTSFACNPPTTTQNTTSNITENSARLNCTAPANYKYLRFRASNNTSWTYLPMFTSNYVTKTGLSPSTTYNWQIMIQCTNGQWSMWSATESFTTSASTICNAPTAAQNTTTSITQYSARLNCSAIGSQKYYRYRKTNTTSWTSTITHHQYYQIYNLNWNTTYEWQTRVYCANGQWSNWSALETFTTQSYCSPPSAAQNSTSSVTQTTARLNCSASGSYRDFRYRVNGTTTWIALHSTSANYKYISGLSPSTTYQWHSRLECSSGQTSVWSAYETFTTLAAPVCNAPTAAQNTTTNITSNAARLNCSVSGEKEFRYRKINDSYWTTFLSTSLNYKVISALSSSTTYQWQSRLNCNGQSSNWSPIETFTTLSGNCDAPIAWENTTSSITHSSARLNCAAHGTRRSFIYRKSGSSNWINLGITSANYVNVYSLIKATTYEWQSRVECVNGLWSDWSPTETFTTTAGTCNPPTSSQNTTTNITSNSAKMNCSAYGDVANFRYRASNTSTWTYVNFGTISGLNPSTTYVWQSKIRCHNGVWSGWSVDETFTTLGSNCYKPYSSQNWTSYIASNSARLNCSAYGTYRDFRYRKHNTSTWTNLTHTTSSFKTIYGLSPSTYYYWQSRVYCSNGQWSDWSTYKTFLTTSQVIDGQTQSSIARLPVKNDEETKGLSLLAVPNPQQVGLKTSLQVTSSKIEEAALVVTDLSGRTVLQETVYLEQGSNRIELNRFEQSGVYLISVRSATEVVSAKLVITE